MSQNVVVKGVDNPVIMQFSFDGDFAASGLNTFTSIELVIGGETYTTLADPAQLFIVNDNELRLKIGDTTTLQPGYYQLEVKGYNATYNDGYLLSGECKPILGNVRVC